MPTRLRRKTRRAAALASRGKGNRPAVFLDRDGVLNRSLVRNGKPYAPRRLEDFRLLPGAARAVMDLKAAGFVVVVVTNQPDVGHGLIAPETLEAMHRRLRVAAPVDAILVCAHRQDEGCSCRKPKPGLIERAIRRFSIARKASYIVGDRWNDVVAGRAAGLYTVFLDRGYTEVLVEAPDLAVKSLSKAASCILGRHRRGKGNT
jgi:D-glycero-D-manno-heptose 1,7-bisphosphate phosphatase